jgi:hypothetical protein
VLTILALNVPTDAQPGDDFSVDLSSSSWFPSLFGTQYHVQVEPYVPGAVIGLWNPDGSGLARNKPNLPYLDRTPKGPGVHHVTVTGQTKPYRIAVTPNSWINKQFGGQIAQIAAWMRRFKPA